MTNDLYAFWFRRDLRLKDNTALYHLMHKLKESNNKWVAFFHLNPDFNEPFDMRYDYYFQTLRTFLDDCNKASLPVQLITGSIEQAFDKLMEQTGNLKGVYFNKDESGYGAVRDYEATTYLDIHNIEYKSYADYHLLSAREVLKEDGSPYKVFTPYYKAWQQAVKSAPLSPSIDFLSERYARIPEIDPAGKDVFAKKLDKTSGSWDELGEQAARKRLEIFVKQNLDHYHTKRDIPAEDGTSRLSAYLKTGVLSVRTIYEKVIGASETKGQETFVQELAWRDFYNMVYAENPNQKTEEIREVYRSLQWNTDEDLFTAWCEGRTGFPIVDAGMRQLNLEGWMHNRLRMITASFLTKDYLIDWRKGEAYFSKKLIDYDPASNIGGWQWAASVGTDAVPYFRVFNPVLQSKRFDPEGVYIKKYVKEIGKVETRFVHEPWKMNQDQQKKADCLLGEDYPLPGIDHQVQRKKAIHHFEEAKNSPGH